jgi:putative endonuclease
MIFHAYVIRTIATGRFYVGHTENLTRRVYEHNNNRTPSIRNRGPWELVHSEEFATRSEAMRRELQIKKMKSHRWIEQLAGASR